MTITPPSRRSGRRQPKCSPCAWPQNPDPRVFVDAEALRHPVLPLGRFELRRMLTHILGKLDLRGANLELRVTSDRSITLLHARHLGGAGPTNVLSFPADEPEDGPANLGSIALNADAVIREAWLYRQDPTDHFIRLLVHALLHLAGYEHGHVMDELTESVVDDCRVVAMETN